MNETEILRGTSRSFYLTLRLLPRALRDEASLGYLLARATDTLADNVSITASQRLDSLRLLRARLSSGELSPGVFAGACGVLDDPSERALLEAFPRLWHQMRGRDAGSRRRLEALLSHILEGQIFDLERFTDATAPLTWGELDRYTYLVAGCVGEFWTDLCAEKLHDFSCDSPQAMSERGKRYGQGLQLVNILRDRCADEVLGRIYVSADAVDACFARARAWLEDGGKYCAALRHGRLRYASLLPCLLGLRTLALLSRQAAHDPAPSKITRGELRWWMVRSLPVWFFRRAVASSVRAASTD